MLALYGFMPLTFPIPANPHHGFNILLASETEAKMTGSIYIVNATAYNVSSFCLYMYCETSASGFLQMGALHLTNLSAWYAEICFFNLQFQAPIVREEFIYDSILLGKRDPEDYTHNEWGAISGVAGWQLRCTIILWLLSSLHPVP